MRKRGLVPVLVVAVALGCGGTPIGSGDSTCDSLSRELTDAIADQGSCETDADCGLIGGAPVQTCSCAKSILRCGGNGIGLNAPELARAQALVTELSGAGCASGCAQDCAPSVPRCLVSEHRCYDEARSCRPVPPDPASDAAPDA
jgi:hypothetical protein